MIICARVIRARIIVHDDVIYVYDDVTYVYDVIYVYDDVTYVYALWHVAHMCPSNTRTYHRRMM
jgi:hypothetical protein